jgi:hypothetical protein
LNDQARRDCGRSTVCQVSRCDRGRRHGLQVAVAAARPGGHRAAARDRAVSSGATGGGGGGGCGITSATVFFMPSRSWSRPLDPEASGLRRSLSLILRRGRGSESGRGAGLLDDCSVRLAGAAPRAG